MIDTRPKPTPQPEPHPEAPRLLHRMTLPEIRQRLRWTLDADSMAARLDHRAYDHADRPDRP